MTICPIVSACLVTIFVDNETVSVCVINPDPITVEKSVELLRCEYGDIDAWTVTDITARLYKQLAIPYSIL